jgi:uncharacterized tellurite resistance protein B-like protein
MKPDSHMLSSICNFFDSFLKPSPQDSTATRVHKVQLACAALLLELSTADQNLDEKEQKILLDILRSTFGLQDQELRQLRALAEQETRTATSLYQFTTLINESYGYEQKVQLLQQLWQVAYADGNVDRYEEHLIRKITDLLYLTHGDFIRAKLASKQDGAQPA